ncbi:MAG: 50S ribosomal protein L15 [Pirellulaceae bacterium]
MSLHEINQDVEKHKRPQRLGRGIGSGKGKTSGRGHKGQKARSGYKALPIFQGTGSPLVRRIPKRGFTNIFALTIAEVNVGDLEANFEAGSEVTPESLKEKKLLRGRYDELKVLGNGELTKKLVVSADRFSGSAREKIEKAGGSATVLPGKTTVAAKKEAAKAARKAAAE